jgi:hypothetical protein
MSVVKWIISPQAKEYEQAVFSLLVSTESGIDHAGYCL